MARVQRVCRKRFLGLTGPMGRRVLKFDGLSGRGLWWRLRRRFIKVSVTDSSITVIWHDKHSADWLAALASPYPAAPDFPRKRGQNKTPRSTLFINGSTISTGYSATVHILHRMCKLVKVSPKPAHKRAFLLIDQPNCGGGKGTRFIREL